MLCSVAIGATWCWSVAASALEVGPISVPVPPPPTVTVTVPPSISVGAVNVPVSQLAPGLGASVAVSPQTGVGASVSLPSSVGPVPLLPAAPSVQAGPGSGGADTAAAGTPAVTGSPVGDAHAVPPRLDDGAARASQATGPSQTRFPATVEGRPIGREPMNSAGRRSPVLRSDTGAVNASLEHASPGGLWPLLRDLASAHGLWIALLLILAIGRLAAGGLMHDAFRRRARLVRSSPSST
jgi:hypothetical protein